MVQTLSVLDQVTKLFERDGKSEDCCFSQFASLGQFLEREHRVPAAKRVKQRQSPFNSVNSGESVILPICSRLAIRFFSQFSYLLNVDLTILSKRRFDTRPEVTQ